MKVIKNSLLCMSIIVLTIAMVNGITEQEWGDLWFYCGLLLMGLLFSIWQFVLERLEFRLYLVEILLNFVVTMFCALLLGKWFGWYSGLENVGYVCIEVLIVFIVGYFLGIMKSRKEIKRINEILKKQ